MKVYNKLVRDNIPEIMIENGATPVTRILTDEEYLKIVKDIQVYARVKPSQKMRIVERA